MTAVRRDRPRDCCHILEIDGKSFYFGKCIKAGKRFAETQNAKKPNSRNRGVRSAPTADDAAPNETAR